MGCKECWSGEGTDVEDADDGVVGIADAVIANRTPAEVMVDVMAVVVDVDNTAMIYTSCNVVYKHMFDDLRPVNFYF